MNTCINLENPAWSALVALPHTDETVYRSNSAPYLSDAREYDDDDVYEIWEDELSDSDEDASDWETVFSDHEDEDHDDYYPFGEEHSGYYEHYEPYEPYEPYEDGHALSGSGSDWHHTRFEQVEPERPFDGHAAADIDVDVDSEVDMLHFSEKGERILPSSLSEAGADKGGSGFVIQAWLVSDGGPQEAVRVVSGMFYEYEDEGEEPRGFIQEMPVLRVSPRNSGLEGCKHGHGPGAGRRAHRVRQGRLLH